ncbi:hypothetical protein [uncultured Mailhella sp.]|uniref:hypothetical protein n=1 Tax=uncultured Mailhella sp. TaxID=1981031 RepID=UPI003209BA71
MKKEKYPAHAKWMRRKQGTSTTGMVEKQCMNGIVNEFNRLEVDAEVFVPFAG